MTVELRTINNVLRKIGLVLAVEAQKCGEPWEPTRLHIMRWRTYLRRFEQRP